MHSLQWTREGNLCRFLNEGISSLPLDEREPINHVEHALTTSED